MLKNSKFGYNWIFKIIIRYYNLIFLISVVLLLVFFLFLFFLIFITIFLFCFFFGARDYRLMIFSESSPIYIWAIAEHELDTLSIRVHNSLTVHDNSWALKFDNFLEFQNVISDSSPTPQRHCDALRTKIYMWLAPRK